MRSSMKSSSKSAMRGRGIRFAVTPSSVDNSNSGDSVFTTRDSSMMLRSKSSMYTLGNETELINKATLQVSTFGEALPSFMQDNIARGRYSRYSMTSAMAVKKPALKVDELKHVKVVMQKILEMGREPRKKQGREPRTNQVPVRSKKKKEVAITLEILKRALRKFYREGIKNSRAMERKITAEAQLMMGGRTYLTESELRGYLEGVQQLIGEGFDPVLDSFRIVDSGNGTIDFDKFPALTQEMGLISAADKLELLKELDKDEDGAISLSDYRKMFETIDEESNQLTKKLVKDLFKTMQNNRNLRANFFSGQSETRRTTDF